MEITTEAELKISKLASLPKIRQFHGLKQFHCSLTRKSNVGPFDHACVYDEWGNCHEMNVVIWRLLTQFLMKGLHHAFDGKLRGTVRHHVGSSSMPRYGAQGHHRAFVDLHHPWQESTHHPQLT